MQEHLSKVASLSATFLLHTLDKRSRIYNNACSNESCRICFTLALPKFQFIAKIFIVTGDRSSTSTISGLIFQPSIVTNLYLLDVAGIIDPPIKMAAKVNISIFFVSLHHNKG